jgi:hypothetical protein
VFYRVAILSSMSFLRLFFKVFKAKFKGFKAEMMHDLAIFDLILGHFRVKKRDFRVHLRQSREKHLKFLVETKSLHKTC